MYPFHIMLSNPAAKARTTLLCGAGLSALLVGSPLPANALLTFNFQETAGGVVLTTSGGFSTLPTTISGIPSQVTTTARFANSGNIITGPTGTTLFAYGLQGPVQTFGTGLTSNIADSTSGDRVRLFGTNAGGPVLQLANNYILGNAISSTATFTGASFASLNLSTTPIFYTFSDGFAPAVEVTFTPIPGPLPLLGIGAAFVASRRLRKKTKLLA
jgi:hypothetical protein